MKNDVKNKVLKHLKEDKREFQKQIQDDNSLKKQIMKSKKKRNEK